MGGGRRVGAARGGDFGDRPSRGKSRSWCGEVRAWPLLDRVAPMNATALEVGIYTRISKADPETQTATHRQEEACRSFAHARGWTVADVFEDVDASAYSGVERPAYERMIREIAAGSLGGVVVWKLDRLVR